MRFLAPIAGVFLIVCAAFSGFTQARFLRHAEFAEGRVVSIVASGSHPEISFKDKVGRQVLYPQGGIIWGFSPGDAVTVYYSEADPKRTAVIKNFEALWGEDIILMVIGTVLVMGPLFSLWAT